MSKFWMLRCTCIGAAGISVVKAIKAWVEVCVHWGDYVFFQCRCCQKLLVSVNMKSIVVSLNVMAKA